jgi:cbb3-type cytochrome oxidase subunit 3
MLRSIVSASGTQWFAIAAMVLFVIAFVLIVLSAILRSKKDIDRQSHLPLEDSNDEVTRE